MPEYKFKCPNCRDIYVINAAFSEYEEVKKSRCTNPECDCQLERVFHGQSAQVFLPAQGGYTKKGFI